MRLSAAAKLHQHIADFRRLDEKQQADVQLFRDSLLISNALVSPSSTHSEHCRGLMLTSKGNDDCGVEASALDGVDADGCSDCMLLLAAAVS